MKDLKLVQKLTRRARNTKQVSSVFDEYNKADKREEVLADSPGAYKLAVKVQRRLDRQLGSDMVAKKPAISFRLNVATVDRFDYDPGAGTDFGIRLTVGANLIEPIRMRPNDIVQFQEGALKGRQLKIVAVTDATHLRLEDVASFVGPESNIVVRFDLSTVKATYN